MLLVSNKEGNSSHSVAQLSTVLMDEGRTNAHHTITNSQLWLTEGVNPRFKKVQSKGKGMCQGAKEREKECV